MKAPIFGVEIPGFLFWVAVLYAVVATGITQLIGRSLSKLYFRQQAVEANFRFDLARVREYSEQIALLKGENREIERAGTVFDDVFRTIRRIIHVRTWLIAFNQFYSQISVIIPYVVIAPFYYMKIVDFGRFSQSADAFGNVNSAMNFFVDRYIGLADFSSAIARLTTFEDSFDKTLADEKAAASDRRSGKWAEPFVSRRRPCATGRTQAGAYRRSRADPAGVGAGRRSVRRRQIDALPCDLGLVAVRLGRNPAAGFRQAHALAATTLYSDRPVAGGARLSGRELEFLRCATARRALSRRPARARRAPRRKRQLADAALGRRAAAPRDCASAARGSRLAVPRRIRPPRSTKRARPTFIARSPKRFPTQRWCRSDIARR